MLNLVFKDLLILKKTLVASVIYGILFTFAFHSNNNPIIMYAAVTTVIGYMLLTSACAYDDKYKAEIILNSLPLKRKDIVLGKYLSMIFFLVIGLIIAFTISSVFVGIGLLKINKPIGVEDIIGCISAFILLGSGYLPIYFKFGYIKSKYLGIIFLVAIFIIPSIIGAFISDGTTPKFINYLNSQPDLLIGFMIIFLLIVITLVSMAFSEKIYLNKDI